MWLTKWLKSCYSTIGFIEIFQYQGLGKLSEKFPSIANTCIQCLRDFLVQPSQILSKLNKFHSEKQTPKELTITGKHFVELCLILNFSWRVFFVFFVTLKYKYKINLSIFLIYLNKKKGIKLKLLNSYFELDSVILCKKKFKYLFSSISDFGLSFYSVKYLHMVFIFNFVLIIYIVLWLVEHFTYL